MSDSNRRSFVQGVTGLFGAMLLGGCDRLPGTAVGRASLQAGEDASMFVQRLLLTQASLAPEYQESQMSPKFKANGTSQPPDRDYKRLAARNFSDFRLSVSGLVDKELSLSLADLRNMPSRTQITRHDCVEGWSCIGKWTGVAMRDILQRAGIKPNARYAVLYCADTMEGGELAKEEGQQSLEENPEPVRYYESIDLEDAYHPQTILAYDMNGEKLPVAHGAPLRLRVERQLGYKMAKYVMRIVVVEKYDDIGDGKGGYWEDRGYDWYAGI